MKQTTPVKNKRYRVIRRYIARGVPGVYRATSFKLKRAALPVLLSVFFAVFTYLSISSTLEATGAISVDRLTVFCDQKQMTLVDNYYKMKARKVGVDLSYEEFCQLVDFRFSSSAQMESIMRKHGKDKSLYGAYMFILISEENEFIDAYRAIEFDDLLMELVARGYLEDVQ